jgi:hypothetical protein
VSWRDRFIEYLYEERDRIQERLEVLTSGKCQLLQIAAGKQEDITENNIAALRNQLAEIEQILAEEGPSDL